MTMEANGYPFMSLKFDCKKFPNVLCITEVFNPGPLEPYAPAVKAKKGKYGQTPVDDYDDDYDTEKPDPLELLDAPSVIDYDPEGHELLVDPNCGLFYHCDDDDDDDSISPDLLELPAVPVVDDHDDDDYDPPKVMTLAPVTADDCAFDDCDHDPPEENLEIEALAPAVSAKIESYGKNSDDDYDLGELMPAVKAEQKKYDQNPVDDNDDYEHPPE